MRTAFRLLIIVAFLGGCCVGGYYWFEWYQTPTVRHAVAAPLYTVGSNRYAEGLHLGKPVVAFGPLPASAFYPGEPAFRQPEEALDWLHKAGKYAKGWRVYLLSGDFDLDTHYIRGMPFINKTLLVTAKVKVPAAQ